MKTLKKLAFIAVATIATSFTLISCETLSQISETALELNDTVNETRETYNSLTGKK